MRREILARPEMLAVPGHLEQRNRGAVVAKRPHLQHQTRPLPPHKEWVLCMSRCPFPISPENSWGAKRFPLHLTFRMRVLVTNLTRGMGVAGGRERVWVGAGVGESPSGKVTSTSLSNLNQASLPASLGLGMASLALCTPNCSQTVPSIVTWQDPQLRACWSGLRMTGLTGEKLTGSLSSSSKPSKPSGEGGRSKRRSNSFSFGGSLKAHSSTLETSGLSLSLAGSKQGSGSLAPLPLAADALALHDSEAPACLQRARYLAF